MKIERRNSGTCSRSVSFNIDEKHIVTNISFEGGCNGNLKGIAALCEGRTAEDILNRCNGIKCGFKSTSCPDQLAKAMEEAIAKLQTVNA
ncbi:MAG: TIGR03905 family TSCPD domain-containing protein [Clostridia bacterium]|nr:TIGR03905 family TSCPD domain-containing protein [Clostridia bacterium]